MHSGGTVVGQGEGIAGTGRYADGETRTPTGSLPLPPQDSVSASSTTSARGFRYSPSRAGLQGGAGPHPPRLPASMEKRDRVRAGVASKFTTARCASPLSSGERRVRGSRAGVKP